MKDKSLILKKAAGIRRRRINVDAPEVWREVKDLGQLNGREYAQIMKKLFSMLGIKIEKSSHGKLRITEYLSKEQEQALLGDDNESS